MGVNRSEGKNHQLTEMDNLGANQRLAHAFEERMLPQGMRTGVNRILMEKVTTGGSNYWPRTSAASGMSNRADEPDINGPVGRHDEPYLALNRGSPESAVETRNRWKD